MKIKCINDSISIENSSQALIEWANNSEMEITVGKTYVVFAISKYFETIFYYILGDESENYPLAFPSNLFQIIDYNISKYWITSSSEFKNPENIKIENGEIISFKEWVLRGDKFYENLLEEVKEDVKIFNNYRDKILNE
jgi:hypothetical protein